MKIAKTILGLTSLALLTACGSDKSSVESGAAGGDLTSAISSISAGVAATGAGMTSTNPAFLKAEKADPIQLNAALCDEHGSPVGYNQSDAIYPFAHTYCALTVSDGDTVRGGFSLAQGLICSLEKGGIQFNGVPQDITVDFTDSDCWPSGGPGGEGPTSATISATGTAPAEFNNYFEKGVVFTVANFGLTFKIAANIDGTKKEFIAYEEWADGNAGVMSGSIDTSTGVLKFEKRDERIRETCEESDSSCGWNRHSRIAASLVMVNNEPSKLNGFSYGYSDFQMKVPPYGGRVVTASGEIATGIKARLFELSTNDAESFKLPNYWGESESATGCVVESGYSAGDCSPVNTGINRFTTNAKFILHPTDGHVDPAAWLAGFAGFNFTEVNLDNDIAHDLNPVK